MSRPVTPNSPALPAASNRLLTNADFARLAEVGHHENQHTSSSVMGLKEEVFKKLLSYF